MIPSSQGFVAAARLGLGWGLNPEPLVADALASGALVPLVAKSALDTPLYWQSSRVLGEALAPLTRALRRAARQMLYPPA
jgi:LysR family transcriptional regulator (chromosome initiation inhibitor)